MALTCSSCYLQLNDLFVLPSLFMCSEYEQLAYIRFTGFLILYVNNKVVLYECEMMLQIHF